MLDLAKNPIGGAATFRGQRHRKKNGTVIEGRDNFARHRVRRPAGGGCRLPRCDRPQSNRGTAAQSQKNGKRSAAYGASPRLNNILNVILANIDIMQGKKAKAHPDRKDRLQRMAAAVDRAAQIHPSVVVLFPQAALRAQVIDVNELVARHCQLLKRTLGSQWRWTPSCPVICGRSRSTVPSSSGAGQSLRQCRDAMPDGGKLLIENAQRDARSGVCRPQQRRRRG